MGEKLDVKLVNQHHTGNGAIENPIKCEDTKGVLLVKFMERGSTINSEIYCETLRKLRQAIHNKCRDMLTSGVVLVHDNAHPHTARCTQELLKQFRLDVFDHTHPIARFGAEQLLVRHYDNLVRHYNNCLNLNGDYVEK